MERSNMTKKYLFKIYLSERTPKNEELISNLKHFLKDKFKNQNFLDIIYIKENPELANSAKVICTPTLIKELPPPIRSVVGDLTDLEKVLAELGLSNQ